MTVSVIIPTYNGRNKIINVLKALEHQSLKEFKTIVVIDGSIDGTIDLLQNYVTTLDLQIIVQENAGRARVRNNGADNAQSDLLIFFDDDMRPLPDCIETHIMHHKKHKGSILTGAQIDDYEIATSDFLRYKCWLSRKWASPLTAYQDLPLPFKNIHLTAANFSISKWLFDKLGGFDNRLKDAEDFDLAIRAYKENIPIYYNHKAFAWHDDIVTAAAYIKRLRQYQTAHLTLRQIKPDIYSHIPLREPIPLKGLKKTLFALFLNKQIVDLIDSPSNSLRFLPRKIRYKLYDLVTTSYGVFFTDHQI